MELIITCLKQRMIPTLRQKLPVPQLGQQTQQRKNTFQLLSYDSKKIKLLYQFTIILQRAEHPDFEKHEDTNSMKTSRCSRQYYVENDPHQLKRK